MTRALDDLQQDIYKAGSVVEAMVDMALQIVDNSQTLASPEADHMSNLLIGLKEYINQAQDYLGERVENIIKKDNSHPELKGVLILDKENKVFIPKAVCDLLSLQPGSLISWESTPNQKVICHKILSTP